MVAAVRRITAILAVASLALVLAACNSTPAAPTLTNPKQILTLATTAMQNAKAIHGRMAASGSIQVGGSLFGGDAGSDSGSTPGASAGTTSGGGMKFSLAGTTGEFWYDNAARNARITLDAPGAGNTTADVIQVGGDTYLRVSGILAPMLGFSGGKYIKMPASQVPASLPAATDVPAAVQSMLDAPDASLVLLGVDKKNGRDSYHLRTNVPKDQLGQSAAAGISVSAVTIDMWIAVDNQQLTHLEVAASGDSGTGTVSADFDYPNSVTIKAPAASDVVGPSAS